MNLDSLFDSGQFNQSLDLETLLKSEKDSGGFNNVIYRPSLKKSNVSEYQSVVKFLPNHKNPKQLWIKNWEVFMKNPNNDEMKSVICPTTKGDKEPSILQDVFFALRNSDNIMEQNLQKHFKRRAVYYALVQIIKDAQAPELEGKIMIFQFGQKIYEKLRDSIQPSSDMIEKHQPFDIINGKHFILHIKQEGEYPNYDSSQFSSKKLPGLIIEGKPVEYKTNPELVKKVLFDDTPDTTPFEYSEWDEKTQRFVAETINAHLNGTVILQKMKQKFPDIFDTIGLGDAPSGKFKQPTPPVVEEDSDLEDFLTGEKASATSSSDDVIDEDFFK